MRSQYNIIKSNTFLQGIYNIFSYYFIKKFDEKAGHEKPFTEVRKEIEAKIFAREMNRLKAEWIKRLRSEAAIEYHIQKH